MSKKKNTPLNVFMESIGLYFSNFDKFVKYMAFPVFGQVLGLTLILVLTYYYAKNIPSIIEKVPSLNNASYLVLALILLILPGMMIFLKAFWDFLLAYGAINSMAENMLKSGKVYDFDAHTELIKRRVTPFIGLWCLVGVFSLVSVIPFFWVLSGILAVFFVLVFQVFTFEPDLSPFGCVRRSLQLVKGHFASTFMLLALVGALTYVLIPQLFNLFFDYTHLTLAFSNLLLPLVNMLPISDWNIVLSYLYIEPIVVQKFAYTITALTISQIIVQYTLPLRSILWSLWYKELSGGKLYISNDDRPKATKKAKKPSEILMEESHKKFGSKKTKTKKNNSKKLISKKIDINILRRAMEKDE